jgi:hypothetical protein
MYDEILGHFSTEELVLDSTMPIEGANARSTAGISKISLDEEEKKFLVGLPQPERFKNPAYPNPPDRHENA